MENIKERWRLGTNDKGEQCVIFGEGKNEKVFGPGTPTTIFYMKREISGKIISINGSDHFQFDVDNDEPMKEIPLSYLGRDLGLKNNN